MDNARIHLGDMVKELIEKAGAKLIYLSPYSPEFSPIENFWSKVKAILRKLKVRTYQDLIDGITDAMLAVTKMIFVIGLLIAVTVPHEFKNCYIICHFYAKLSWFSSSFSNSDDASIKT